MNAGAEQLGSSFAELLAARTPGRPLLRVTPDADVPHGTTIVACTFAGGFAMAGDRRATWGHQIAQHDVEKVFPADETSVVGVAGAAGIAVGLVRLFRVELEHYEKIEGVPLSFEGKANRLAGLIRANLDDALRGLGALPLLAGWDGSRGRLVSYDVVGGRYDEQGFHAVGSGAAFARGSLKKLYRGDLDERGAVTALVQALVDSSDDDAATAGPDVVRGIYPLVYVGGPDGVRRWSDADLAALVDDVVAARRRRPDGPEAPLI